jgi:glucose/arabinose dehydrogenase
MPISRTAYCGVSAAFYASALLLAAFPAQAQQDPKGPPPIANPQPAEGPLMGRPETPGAQALAPVSAPPLVTPADKLPLDKIKLPEGFKVEVYASGIKDPRSIRVGEKGTVFVSNWEANKVWAITEKDGKRTAKAIYEGLDWPRISRPVSTVRRS